MAKNQVSAEQVAQELKTKKQRELFSLYTKQEKEAIFNTDHGKIEIAGVVLEQEDVAKLNKILDG